MKQQLAAGIVTIAGNGGIGTGFAVRELRADPAPASATSRSATPTPTPSASASSDAPAAPQTQRPKAPATSAPTDSTPALLPVTSMQITTGAVGPVSAGMSKAAAAATGYFEVDLPSSTCEGATPPLAWTEAYAPTFDVWTTDAGAVDSIGVRQPGPRTRSGLQIGSTYGEVRDVIGTDIAPEEAGYGQTGLFVDDGSGWIGFLFDAPVAGVDDADRVSFIEVTRGRKPMLLRDGC